MKKVLVFTLVFTLCFNMFVYAFDYTATKIRQAISGRKNTKVK